jgi:PTS system mannose-specific IIA component
MEISNSISDQTKSTKRISGIVVTHSGIGQELLKAAESIVGPQENLTALSSKDVGFDSLCRQIHDAIPPDRDAIIMVDYFGGSAHIAARALRKLKRQTTVVSGVNLPMLLSFVTKREQFSYPELVEVIRTDAIRGIR